MPEGLRKFMKKLFLLFFITGGMWLTSCSNEKTGINNESVTTGAENDSSTTNPVNSEYGTPNASENPVDSAQSVNEGNNPQ